MRTVVKNNAQLKNAVSEKLAVLKDDNLQNQVMNALDSVDIQPAYLTDKWVYRMIVGGLCAIVLSVIIAVSAVFVKTPETTINVPVVLVTVTSTALGALAGLLAPSPRQQQTD